jgi:hypothetical protein
MKGPWEPFIFLRAPIALLDMENAVASAVATFEVAKGAEQAMRRER